MKIDAHCHAFPLAGLQAMQQCHPDLIRVWQDDAGNDFATWANTPLPAWNAERRLARMDIAGIDIEVLQNPIIYHRIDDNLPQLCRAVNDSLAQVCAEHPQRFRFLASIPLNDIDQAVSEIDRAVAAGAVGIVIPSNASGKYFDQPQFLPFWQAVAERDIAVYMHPLYSQFYRDDEGPTLLAFPFDTTLSAVKLVLSGLFEKFSLLKIVLSHMGGALPYMAKRVDVPFIIPDFLPGYAERLDKLPSEYMRHFYLDTALNWSASAFECARDLVGIEHLLFASDYFIETTDYDVRTLEFIESLALSDKEKAAVFSGNCQRIMAIEP